MLTNDVKHFATDSIQLQLTWNICLTMLYMDSCQVNRISRICSALRRTSHLWLTLKKMSALICLLDLSKVFDNVNRGLLLPKLKEFSIFRHFGDLF